MASSGKVAGGGTAHANGEAAGAAGVARARSASVSWVDETAAEVLRLATAGRCSTANGSAESVPAGVLGPQAAAGATSGGHAWGFCPPPPTSGAGAPATAGPAPAQQQQQHPPAPPRPALLPYDEAAGKYGLFRLQQPRAAYEADVAASLEAIASGETYEARRRLLIRHFLQLCHRALFIRASVNAMSGYQSPP